MSVMSVFMKYLLTNGEGGSGTSASVTHLQNGASALDAIEAGIKIVERDPKVRSVGYGGAPNALGEMELDSSVMCGKTFRVGSIGALKGFIHPISVARAVMERLPHVMLVGEGAARFAREIGAEAGENLSPEAKRDYSEWLEKTVGEGNTFGDGPLIDLLFGRQPVKPFGTTTYIAKDSSGNLGGGISTSGWGYKYPGRLGDSPIIGAGLYVDNEFGGASCTNTGEMTIRASTARSIVLYMKKGATVTEACYEAVNDLKRLQGGHLGPVTIHAVDRDGTPCVLAVGSSCEIPYWYWCEGMKGAEKRVAVDVRVQ